MSKKYLLLLTVLLSACSASNQWEDLTAKYNATTHILSTNLGHYQVYFPEQPVAIPGQEINHYVNTDMGLAANSPFTRTRIPVPASDVYHHTQDEHRADFQSVGKELTLTARHNIVDSGGEVKNLPGLGNMARIKESNNGTVDVKKEITDAIDKSEKQFGLTESSRSPFKVNQFCEGFEVTGKKEPWNVFKLRAMYDRRTGLTYTLIAEGSQKAVDGVEAQRFFDSFANFQSADNLILLSPLYASSESRERLNKIKDQWNATQTPLYTTIVGTGLGSAATLAQVKETFKAPSEKLKKSNPSSYFEWQNYFAFLQDKLGDNYRVVGKDDMSKRKVFGQRSKAESYLDITQLDTKSALAILFDDEGKVVDTLPHTPVADLMTRMCEAISRHGVSSQEAFTEISQAFGYPMPGVSLDLLVEMLRNNLGEAWVVNSVPLDCFKSSRDTNSNDSCILIQLRRGGGIRMLLDGNGKLMQSEYF